MPEPAAVVATLTAVVGAVGDSTIAEQLHRLEHAGLVERIVISEADLGRHRFRAVSDRGTEFGVAVDRGTVLADGSVLELSEHRAVVVQLAPSEVLVLEAANLAGGIQLGWHAGHLHWRVRFEGDRLHVLLDSSVDEHLRRIEPFLADGSIRVVSE